MLLDHAPRRGLSTLFHILCIALLAACSGGEGAREGGRSDSAGAGGAAGDGRLRVALLTPGPISDQSWNAGAYAGLMRIRDSLGAQVSHIQTKTPAEFEENFREYGAQGYDLVFGHGFEFQDAAQRVAPSYPKTSYVVTSGTTVAPNLAGMSFAFEEASYLAGLIGGAMTTSNLLGAIGGTELPPVKRSFEAFAAGARAANPRAQTVTSYIGNWDDVSAGREQALVQIGRGVDVLFQNADAAGLGIFQAAREKKVWVFGSNSDQNHVAPEVTLASVVIDLPHAFLEVARERQAGRFQGRVIPLGMSNDVVRLTMNPTVEARIPAAVRARVDSARAEIVKGNLPKGSWSQ